MIAKAVRDIGYRTDIEHGGGLGDNRRPGDVIVYNWSGEKHLLIDVAIINPLCISHTGTLIKEGVGAPATEYENIKRNAYSDIDSSRYEFIPFIIESCGGIGQAAFGLCKEIESRREAKAYWDSKDDSGKDAKKFPDPLLTAINLEVQRFNSRMILERQPPPINLIDSAFVKCEAEVAKKKIEAARSISRGSFELSKYNLKHICTDASKSRKQESSSASLKTVNKKWPPDPPDTRKTQIDPPLQLQLVIPVPVVEHPLATKQKTNSQSVSASTRAFSKIVNERIEEAGEVIPNCTLQNRRSKDPTAIEWEPPGSSKRRRTWKS